MGIAAGLAFATAGALAFTMFGGQGGPGDHPVPVAIFEPTSRPEAKAIEELRISGDAEVSWVDFMQNVGKAAKMPVTVHWSQLKKLDQQEKGELNEDTRLGVTFQNVKLSSALLLLNDTQRLPQASGVDYRVIDGSLVFSSAAFFDKTELTVVTYDLSEMPNIEVGGEAGTQEQIKSAIQSLVEPDHWNANGGDRATLTEVGSKLFIKAPKRMHAQVEWILGEIKNTGKAGKAGAAGGAKATDDWRRVRPGLPRAGVAFGSDHKPAEQTFELRSMRAQTFRDLLDRYFDTAPGLKECDFERVMEIPAGGAEKLILKASERQVELADRLRQVVDRDASKKDTTESETRTIALKSASADQTTELLKQIFEASPYWRTAPRPRTVAADSRTNSVIIAASGEQVRMMTAIIELIDQPKPEGAAMAVPDAVRENIGPGEVVTLRHGLAEEIAPIVARRLVEWSREVGGQQFVVTKHGEDNGVLVAGTPLARGRALAMLRELDEAVGRAGQGEGFTPAGNAGITPDYFGASASLAGVRRTSVPVLTNLPILNRFFAGEEAVPIVIRAEGGKLRVTAPDGTSVEAEEIRVAPQTGGK
ncbi:MAG: secretin N-terminal domain-containing protein [Planctomycetota bacterium]